MDWQCGLLGLIERAHSRLRRRFPAHRANETLSKIFFVAVSSKLKVALQVEDAMMAPARGTRRSPRISAFSSPLPLEAPRSAGAGDVVARGRGDQPPVAARWCIAGRASKLARAETEAYADVQVRLPAYHSEPVELFLQDNSTAISSYLVAEVYAFCTPDLRFLFCYRTSTLVETTIVGSGDTFPAMKVSHQGSDSSSTAMLNKQNPSRGR